MSSGLAVRGNRAGRKSTPVFKAEKHSPPAETSPKLLWGTRIHLSPPRVRSCDSWNNPLVETASASCKHIHSRECGVRSPAGRVEWYEACLSIAVTYTGFIGRQLWDEIIMRMSRVMWLPERPVSLHWEDEVQVSKWTSFKSHVI